MYHRFQVPWKFSTQTRYREKLLHKPYPADPKVPESVSAQAMYWTSPGTTKRFRKNQVPQVPPRSVTIFLTSQTAGDQDKITPPLTIFLVKK